jgi:hypothetical protein
MENMLLQFVFPKIKSWFLYEGSHAMPDIKGRSTKHKENTGNDYAEK